MQNTKIDGQYLLTTDKLAIIIGLIDKYLKDNYGNGIYDFMEKAKNYNKIKRECDKIFYPADSIMFLLIEGFNSKSKSANILYSNILGVIKSSEYDMVLPLIEEYSKGDFSKEIDNDTLNEIYSKLPFINKEDYEKIDSVLLLINNVLNTVYSKRICRITAEELQMSQQQVGKVVSTKKNNLVTSSTIIRKRDDKTGAETIQTIKRTLTSSQLEEVVASLSNNILKYENLFREKIWIIESDFTRVIKERGKIVLPKESKIIISPGRFFHLMGFDYKCFIGNELGFGDRNKNLKQLIELCGTKNKSKIENLCDKYIRECDEFKRFASISQHSAEEIAEMKKKSVTRGNALYEILLLIIENNDRLINMLGDGEVSGLISVPKLTMKQYAFDRMRIITDSSGILVFDKSIAKLNDKDIRTANAIYLLNDIIRDNKLSFIFSEFKDRESIFGEKNASSIFVGQKPRFENDEFYGQYASITKLASAYSPHDFNFSIREDNDELKAGGESVDLSASGSGPLLTIAYSDEEKYNSATSLLAGIPDIKNKEQIQKYASNLLRRIIEKRDDYNMGYRR